MVPEVLIVIGTLSSPHQGNVPRSKNTHSWALRLGQIQKYFHFKMIVLVLGSGWEAEQVSKSTGNESMSCLALCPILGCLEAFQTQLIVYGHAGVSQCVPHVGMYFQLADTTHLIYFTCCVGWQLSYVGSEGHVYRSSINLSAPVVVQTTPHSLCGFLNASFWGNLLAPERNCLLSPREADAADLVYLCLLGIIWKWCLHKNWRICSVSNMSLRSISK